MTAFRMRPWYLRSAIIPLVAGFLALGLGLIVDDAGTALGIAITTVVAGAGWWALVSRPRVTSMLREADRAARPAGEVDLRNRPLGVGTLVLFTLLAACGLLSPSVSGLLFGMALGQGADFLRIRAWERAHAGELVVTRDGYAAVPAAAA